jgi:hypothetical protein
LDDEDGQPIDPALLGLPPADGAYTAWFVPALGREPYPSYVVIAGDPRDPDAIYYWAEPDEGADFPLPLEFPTVKPMPLYVRPTVA